MSNFSLAWVARIVFAQRRRGACRNMIYPGHLTCIVSRIHDDNVIFPGNGCLNRMDAAGEIARKECNFLRGTAKYELAGVPLSVVYRQTLHAPGNLSDNTLSRKYRPALNMFIRY